MSASFNHQQILEEHRKFSVENGINLSGFAPSKLSEYQRKANGNVIVQNSQVETSLDYKRIHPFSGEFQSISSINEHGSPNQHHNKEFSNSFVDLGSKNNIIQSREILIMTIGIGNGKSDIIHVFENDNPNELAEAFCMKHNLNPNIISLLAQNISQNIQQVLKDKLAQQNEDYSFPIENHFNNNGIQNNQFSNQNQQQQEQLNSSFLNEKHFNNDDEPNNKLAMNHKASNQDFLRLNTAPAGNYTSSSEQSPLLCRKTKNTGQDSSSSIQNKSNKHLNLSYDITNIRQPNFSNQSFSRASISSQQCQKRKSLQSNSIIRSTNKKKHNTDILQSNKKKSMLMYRYPPESNGEQFNVDSKYLDQIIAGSSPNKTNNSENQEFTFTPKINQHSKNLVKNRLSAAKLPVHERLHNIAIKRKSQHQLPQSSISPLKTINRSSSQSDINYGSLLYIKGLKKQEKIYQSLLNKKREIQEKEERECTFKPCVNPISQEIIINKNRSEPLEEILIKFGKEIKEKRERERSLKYVQEIESCPFKPEINPLSEKIATEKDKLGPLSERHEKLFYDHKVRQVQQEMRQKTQEQQCTFSPNVNHYPSKLIEQTTFEERNRKLLEKAEKYENIKKQKEIEELLDPETGKPFFKPKIGRAPKTTNRDRANMPIGDYLYNRRTEIENTKRSILEKHQKTIDDSMVKSNERSQIIMENIKRKKLATIFQSLDSDADGKISAKKIDISQIDTATLEMIAPLLCDMEERNKILTEDDFIEACERLLRKFNVEERAKLILGKHDTNCKTYESFNFKPQINEKSKQLAENRPRLQPGITHYELQMEGKRAIELKLKQERERRIQEELKECSFKPLIYSSNPLLNF